jgi:hypothetical protein
MGLGIFVMSYDENAADSRNDFYLVMNEGYRERSLVQF